MRTTVDAAGRVVLPKSLRDAMRLEAGQEIEISFVDGRLEIEVPPAPVRIDLSGETPVGVPSQKMPDLTDEMVRDTVERVRR